MSEFEGLGRKADGEAEGPSAPAPDSTNAAQQTSNLAEGKVDGDATADADADADADAAAAVQQLEQRTEALSLQQGYTDMNSVEANVNIVFDEEGNAYEEIEIDGDGPLDEMEEVDLDNVEWADEQQGMEELKDEEVEDLAVTVFTGHSDAVYCVAASTITSGLVVTGGGDDCAYLWKVDLETAEIASCLTLSGHSDTVNSVGFSRDGRFVSTGAYDGSVRVWNTETGMLMQCLEGPEDIEWTNWHSIGNVLLAGSRDGTVWMWLVQTGACMNVFAGHEGPVTCGCFSGDGKLVCTGSADGTVRIWGPKVGKCRHVFQGHEFHDGPITCLATDSAGELLLSGSEDGTVRLMHIGGGAFRVVAAFVHSKPKELAPQDELKEHAELEGGGAIDEEELDEDEEELEEIVEGTMSIESVGFCHTHRWIASAGMDGALKIWDVVSGQCRHTCIHPGGVIKLLWHPLFPFLYTACTDDCVRLWSGLTGECLQTFTGHSDMVLDMSICFTSQEDGEDLIFTASDDHTSRLFRLRPFAFVMQQI